MSNRPVKPKGLGSSANCVRKTLQNRLLDVVFPQRCAGCGDWCEEIFCPDCSPHLKKIIPPLCLCCGEDFDPLAQVLNTSLCARCRDNRYHAAPEYTLRRAPFRYAGPIRDAIHALKYHGKTALAAPLAGLLLEYLKSCAGSTAFPMDEIELFVPVPLHPVRRWRRGYNQSTLLARELGRCTGKPTIDILQRVRHTTPQVELDTQERAQNVQGAFAWNSRLERKYSGQSVLLLDDVSSTGATMNECARVLRQNGINEIYALTLAR